MSFYVWIDKGLLKVLCSFTDQYGQPPNSLIGTIKKLQSGYIAGTRVHLGLLSEFISTSCVTKLSFVKDFDESNQGLYMSYKYNFKLWNEYVF